VVCGCSASDANDLCPLNDDPDNGDAFELDNCLTLGARNRQWPAEPHQHIATWPPPRKYVAPGPVDLKTLD